MTDNRTISELEAEGYLWIGCECCKGTVWVPFKMIRRKIPHLSAMTLDELGAKMRCDECGKRPERYYLARQRDAPGFAKKVLIARLQLFGSSRPCVKSSDARPQGRRCKRPPRGRPD